MPRLRARDRTEELARMILTPYRAKITDAEYARITGTTSATIGNYRKARTKIPLEVAIDAANASGMTDEEWLQLRRIK